jgi:hypothetical protein
MNLRLGDQQCASLTAARLGCGDQPLGFALMFVWGHRIIVAADEAG